MANRIRQHFVVIKPNYQSDGFNIYRVVPTGQVMMRKHPIYRSFSVISNSELIIGESYEADLEIKNKNGNEEYHVARIYFEFPEFPSEQWSFLERYCNNNGAKKLFKRFTELAPQSEPILSKLQVEGYRDSMRMMMDAYKLTDKFDKVVNNITNMQAISQFLEALPAVIADELTDFEAEQLSKLEKNNPSESARSFVANPWLAMACDGFGFKRVDKIRARLASVEPNNLAYAVDNHLRVYYGAYDVLENRVFNNGHTYITNYEFKNLMVQELGVDRELVNQFLDYDYQFVSVFGYFKIHVSEGIVTSERMWKAENLIYEMMRDNQNEVKPFFNWDRALKQFKVDEDLELTDEQLSIFKSVNENRYSLLTGPGGTGKTFTVAKLIQFAREQGIKVALMAPTGKAAQVLKSYSGRKTSTIHTAFQIQPGKLATAGKIPATEPQLIIIDEFSMVDSELLGDVFAAYKGKKEKMPRFLFIGDENQLPSVGAGNLLHSFIKLRMAELTRLTKVFRIKSEEGGIVTLTESLRQGRFPFKNNDGEIFPVGKDFWGWHSDSQEDVFVRSLRAYQTMIKRGVDPSDIFLLSPKNGGLTGQMNFNTELQTIARNAQGKSPDEPHHTINKYGIKVRFYEGDLIMSLVNQKLYETRARDASLMDFNDKSPMLSVSNGDVGRVLYVGHESLLVEFDGVSVFVSDTDLKDYQLGYAFTIHKSQGSEAKYGIMAVTSADAFQLNSNLLYTGASRFKEKLYLIANFNTIRAKAKLFINQDRRTLFDYLDELEDIQF